MRLSLLLLTIPALAFAQKPVPCETPRVRDVAPLTAAIAQDKAMAQVFLKASQSCQMAQSDACDAVRIECGTQLAATLKAQVGFDDGAWLRDMLLPYGGFYYPPSRQFQPGASALDTACNGDSTQLMSASSRRSLQAARRQALLDEYPRYVAWVQDQAKACRERSTTDEARRAQERLEAEKLAAAALAAKTAEELRQKSEGEAKQKADEAARKAADAQKEAERQAQEARAQADKERRTAEERARDEKEAAERKAKDEKETAEQKAKDAEEKAKDEKEAAEKRAEDERERLEKEKRAEKDEREANERKAKEEAEREKADAERKLREAAEARLVKEREDRKLALRTQKDKLNADAAAAEKRAAEIAGMTFTATQSQEAAQLNTERMQAIERAKTMRAQAAEIVIDDSDERSRGSLGAMIGAGASTWPGTAALALGGQALVHLGFWGVAPSEGLSSGLEVRALARFLATVGTGSAQQAEIVANVRYFFGRFGVGGAIEFRWNQPVREPGTVNIGFGPSVGFAFVDTPKTRVMLNGSWLPLTQRGFQNAYRMAGDLEVSHEFLTFSVAGGLQTQPISQTEGTILAWYFGAFGGVRFRW